MSTRPTLPLTSRSRRAFFEISAVSAATAALGVLRADAAQPKAPESAGVVKIPGKPVPFKISLAQWSLHQALADRTVDTLDFAKIANTMGIDGIEYVNRFFKNKARDKAYLADLKRRAAGEGVWSVLIMIDNEGDLGRTDVAARKKAIENHKVWMDAAAFLGCHAVRVNAHSDAKDDTEASKLLAESMRELGEYGDGLGINAVIENHGGRSSNAQWLVRIMKQADHPRVGTLPDFGNFKINDDEQYDPYEGVEEMMPWAKSVSAKSNSFDKKGNESTIDYRRMMKIVMAAGYRGYVGIEYGSGMNEIEGIMATKKLLERVRAEIVKAAKV